jgi:hypothetical protein
MIILVGTPTPAVATAITTVQLQVPAILRPEDKDIYGSAS